ncbi:MAG: LptF/LptG family permease [Acidobacteriota bacterium]
MKLLGALRPDRLWRYIFGEILSPSLLGLGVYVLVFLMNALFELAELAIKKDLPLLTVGRILFYYLPRVLVLTTPMAILLGVLVGIGRLSTDSEIVALRAAGVSYWKVLYPALVLGLIGWGFGSYLMLQVEPEANYRRRSITTRLAYSADPRREIKPRVFFEEIPGILLYADEVHQGGDFLEKVFIHQTREGGEELTTVARRVQIDYDREQGVAFFYMESGLSHSVDPDDPESYHVSQFERQMLRQEPDEAFRIKSSLLSRPSPRNWREQNLSELARSILRAGAITHEETRRRVIGTLFAIVHERFALPVACLVFALLGVPLGIMNRRGGKASGFSLSIAIAILYWILLSTGEGLVKQGRLSPFVGLWVGNALLGALGVVLFLLRERTESLQISFLVPARLQRALAALRRREEDQLDARRLRALEVVPEAVRPPEFARVRGGRRSSTRRSRRAARRRGIRAGGAPSGTLCLVPSVDPEAGGSGGSDDLAPVEPGAVGRSRTIRVGLLAGIAVLAGLASISFSPFLLVAITLLALFLVFSTTMDRYVLARYGTVLAGCLASLFTLVAVYEFIQIMDELVERSLPVGLALSYLKYRSPWILAQILPMSSLVATFMTFGAMSRLNEVVALKASGTSIYRLSMPVVVVAVALSTLAYVNYDYLMPHANRKARQVKDVIKGKTPRTYRVQKERWVFGEQGRLYNFATYTPPHFPVLPAAGRSGTFQGFSAYRLDPETFQIRRRVHARNAVYDTDHWVLRDGWIREFRDGRESFEAFAEKRFDFPERPAYFVGEWKSPQQMTFAELKGFVRDLDRRGYDVQELAVDLYDKSAIPLVSLTMVVLGLPFCFRMGRRGSLYGIGVAIVLALLFLVTFSATNALGGVGLVPPFLAAWAPNILFAGSGVYLLLRTST